MLPLTLRPLLIAATLVSLPTLAMAGPNDSDWVQMFNPKDTSLATNWDFKITTRAMNVDPLGTFKRTVVGSDTVLEVNVANYTNFNGMYGHIGYKIRPFNYFVVRVEHQFYGSQAPGNPGSWAVQNNGIMHHSQSVASMSLNQNFPVSMEAQLLGPGNTGADGNSSMNLCTPGTSYYTAATGGTRNDTHCNTAATKDRAQALAPNWAWARVEAYSDSIIRYYFKDSLVLTYYRPVQYNGDNQVSNPSVSIVTGTAIKGGYILLQSESHGTRFRRVEVLNLEGCKTPTDANYKAYFVKHDSTACAGSTGIKGTSPQAARYAAPMSFVGNVVKVGGSDRVTLEAWDMRGTRIGSHTAQAPFQWSPGATTHGVYLLKAITPKGTYTEKATLF